ncbi:hypothetical protein [Galactobacter valiniphilus]|uniref:hypothetical protein n=1 Tax=Galactobacter valiniphilus TaxID=2676122 RepID=UPI0037370D76
MSDFLSHVRELDGTTRTLANALVGQWEVMVGGGPELFVLTASAGGGQRTANAITSAPVTEAQTVSITVSGQSVEGPALYALTIDEVAEALEHLAAETLPAERWIVLG